MLIKKLRKTKNKWKKGFTLVELLVSIAIMSILTLSVFLITNSASLTFSRGSQTIVADDVKDLVLAVVKQKLYAVQDIALEATPYSDSDGTTIDSELLKTHHALFFYNGRIYILPSNPDGIVDIDTEGNKLPVGSQPLLNEQSYDKYKAQFSISPVYNARKDKYLSVCINIYIFDDNLNLKASGKETINLLNVEKNELEVVFEGQNNFVCYYN